MPDEVPDPVGEDKNCCVVVGEETIALAPTRAESALGVTMLANVWLPNQSWEDSLVACVEACVATLLPLVCLSVLDSSISDDCGIPEEGDGAPDPKWRLVMLFDVFSFPECVKESEDGSA